MHCQNDADCSGQKWLGGIIVGFLGTTL